MSLLHISMKLRIEFSCNMRIVPKVSSASMGVASLNFRAIIHSLNLNMRVIMYIGCERVNNWLLYFFNFLAYYLFSILSVT